MSKKYLVWKDANCNGENVEWIQMSGQAFARFIGNAENKNRYFIKLPGDSELDIIFAEVTEKKYKQWKKENNRKEYLKKGREKFGVLSLDVLVNEDSQETLGDIIQDETEDIEDIVLKNIMHKKLSAALKTLSHDELALVRMLYFSEEKKFTEQEIANILGISQAAVHKQKMKILKKLKKVGY